MARAEWARASAGIRGHRPLEQVAGARRARTAADGSMPFRVEPRGLGARGQDGARLRGLASPPDAQRVAQPASRACHEVEQLGFGAGLHDVGGRLAGHRVLQAQVEPDPPALRVLQGGVGAQRCTASVPSSARSRARVSRAQALASASGPSSTLARATFSPGTIRRLAAGAELGREHLGQSGGEPLGAGRAGEVLEARAPRPTRRGVIPSVRRASRSSDVRSARPASPRSGNQPTPSASRSSAARATSWPALASAARRASAPVCGAGFSSASWRSGGSSIAGPVDRLDDFRRGREARRRIALQAAEDGRLPARVEAGDVDARRRRRLPQALDRGRERRVADERHGAGQHLVEDDARARRCRPRR